MDLVNALFSIAAFTAIPWTLPGPLVVIGVEIPHAMVFTAFAYVFIAAIIVANRPQWMIGWNEVFHSGHREQVLGKGIGAVHEAHQKRIVPN
jgi:hypothetical protein